MKLPVTAPGLNELLDRGELHLKDILGSGIGPEVGGVYAHWDHLRHLRPPARMSSEAWWAAIKLSRKAIERALPLHDMRGDPFMVSVTDTMHRKLHFLDREAAGVILGADTIGDDAMGRRYLMHSLIEEAMTSSQLEGASTTRQAAKEMLGTGRLPRDRSERMIFNNYATMQSLRGLREHPLTVDTILEIHHRLMHDALDDPGEAGRLRTAADNVIVQDRGDPNITLHVPPPATELPTRLQALCDFANAGNEDDFLHPIVRAIAIHFQIGYDHPFCDGNGRTARALFYWSMLRSGYWLSEYISISSVLKRAPAKYVRAYLHSESDDTDMSYFVAHQLDVLVEAVHSLHGYLARKGKQRRQAETLLRPGSPMAAKLNHRQRTLLLHAIRHPHGAYEIAGHQATHRVSYPTARADLIGLVASGLLSQEQLGKSFLFRPVADLARRLEQ